MNFDNIGNRISALEGTEPTEPSSYTANSLNQYVEREIADVIEVLGQAQGQTCTMYIDRLGDSVGMCEACRGHGD